jgi:hypothetical protein
MNQNSLFLQEGNINFVERVYSFLYLLFPGTPEGEQNLY